MGFKRLENENEEQFLWRIGQAKEHGLIDLDWNAIADVMNKTFREDESEYRTEAAYRKPYQQAARFANAGVFENSNATDDIIELRKAKQEIKKEKQKLFDERRDLNRILRDEARIENDLNFLSELIATNSKSKYVPQPKVLKESDNDLIICVSDLHLGMTNSNVFGEYSPEIAFERLVTYHEKICEIAYRHHCKNAYVLFLGDLISGEIHLTTQLENRECLTEQIQRCGVMLSDFVYSLTGIFENIYINGVAGNHSRVAFKDDVLRGNKLDSLIPWYLKASLQHLTNVHFVDEDNYDPTIGHITIRGKEYILLHGDYDTFNEAGVSKLVMMIGYKPHSILYGHMHHNSYDDIAGVKIVRSGSFAGTGDNYCISKRLYGKPSQMAVVVNDDGVSCCYPVDL